MNSKLKQRFVKDYNLPINVFEDDIFDYYVNLYDFFPKDKWLNLKRNIVEKYNGNVEQWLDYCAEVRDYAIDSTMASHGYYNFNSMDMSKYNILPTVGEKSYYTEVTDGKKFISIDLKKANFQALKYAGVLFDDNYDNFIAHFGGDDYIKNSKYLRQVIFGKMNPGRTINVERYMMKSIYDYLKPYTDDFCLEIYSMNSDELVYEVHGNNIINEDILVSFETEIADKLGMDVRVELVEIHRLPIVNVNGNKVDAYERKNLITGETVLKKASTTFFPQIYKLWKGKEIEDKDKVFFFEDQLCTFNEPLRYGD